MLEEVKKILAEEYRITDVTRDTDFKKELGLNSFDFMNLICIAEEKYRNMSTVGELCDYLESLVK